MARWLEGCRWKVRTGLIGGVAILLLVDVIWVGSAGLTRFLFTEESYEKPFFTTYFKTSLFPIYLVAFLFWRPWQRQCCREVCRCRREAATVRDVGAAAPHHPTDDEKNQRDDSSGAQTLLKEDHQESPTRDDSGIFTNTACTEFPPDGDASVVNRQHCPSIVVSEHPEECCSMETAVTPSCPVNNSTCLIREQQQSQADDRSSVTNSERNLEEGSSGVAELVPNTTEVLCEVVQRRIFDVSSLSGSVNQAVCPIRPKLDVCLLGPPKFQPLGCYESDDERDRSLSTTLPPCRHKCCKVRFKTTIEVRERTGGDCQRTSLLAQGDRPIKPLSIWKVMGVAFIFGILWFFANYLYALGLDLTTVAAVNTISAVSGVFVMILAAVPVLNVTEGDKFTLSRLAVTLLSVCGAVMVSLSPSGVPEDGSDKKFNYGALYALGGAGLYALYLVLLKKVVQHHEALDIPMFFGFVGLFDFLLLLPLVVIWDLTGIEKFELPPTANVWTLLLVNGFVGTVLSELLWLWAVFLTSPLLGTLALSLVTPLSITYSIVVGKASFSWLFFCGAVLIIVAFLGVTILDHFGAWDPLWVGIKKLFVMAKDARGYRSLSPESQRLISSEQSQCDHEYLIT